MSFLDWTFIVMIVLMGLDIFLSPYIKGSPLSLTLTTIIIVLGVINVMGAILDLQEDIQNNQEVVNSDSLKCEPSENGDWICKKIKPVATFDANSKLFIKKSLPKDNSFSLKCTVADDGSYFCKK